MKLTDKEAAVLASVDLRADAPIGLIRRASGLREHAVRYALRALIDRKVITPLPFVNLHRLGFTVYTLFFTIGGQNRGTHEALISSLISARQVLWAGEFAGEFQYGIGFAAKNIGDLTRFLSDISQKHGAIFQDRALSAPTSSTIYSRRYLSADRRAADSIRITGDSSEPSRIDSLDAKILSALTSYGALSRRQLALKIQVPLSTVELRIQKLKAEGIIVREIYSVDAAKFDMTSYKLLLYTKGLDTELTRRIDSFCRANPYVTSLIESLGSWGYEIDIDVYRPEELSQVVQQAHEAFGASIQTIKTLTRFSYKKMRFFIEHGEGPEQKETM